MATESKKTKQQERDAKDTAEQLKKKARLEAAAKKPATSAKSDDKAK